MSKPNINVNLKLSGQYRAEIKRGDGTIEELPWFGNLITDLGLNRLGDYGYYVIQNIKVGTGTSIPAVTQTSLDAKIAQVNMNTYSGLNKGAPNYESDLVYTFVFPQGAVVGNITEVGVGWDNGDSLFSRSLFKNTNGDPVSITLTAIDQLTLYYKVTVFPNINDVTGTFNISGVPYNFTVRPSSIDNFFNSANLLTNSSYFIGLNSAVAYPAPIGIGPKTGYPSGANYNNTGLNYVAYIANSHYVDVTVTWGTTSGNDANGLKTFYWNYGGYNAFQMELATPIMKTNTQVLTLTFRLSWGR